MRIVDDDVDLKSLLPENLENTLDEDIEVEEDKPVVAEIIDDRPEHIKMMEMYRKSDQWKTLKTDSGKWQVVKIVKFMHFGNFGG